MIVCTTTRKQIILDGVVFFFFFFFFLSIHTTSFPNFPSILPILIGSCQEKWVPFAGLHECKSIHKLSRFCFYALLMTYYLGRPYVMVQWLDDALFCPNLIKKDGILFSAAILVSSCCLYG